MEHLYHGVLQDASMELVRKAAFVQVAMLLVQAAMQALKLAQMRLSSEQLIKMLLLPMSSRNSPHGGMNSMPRPYLTTYENFQ